jgi:hypothetical protein
VPFHDVSVFFSFSPFHPSSPFSKCDLLVLTVVFFEHYRQLLAIGLMAHVAGASASSQQASNAAEKRFSDSGRTVVFAAGLAFADSWCFFSGARFLFFSPAWPFARGIYIFPPLYFVESS